MRKARQAAVREVNGLGEIMRNGHYVHLTVVHVRNGRFARNSFACEIVCIGRLTTVPLYTDTE